LAVEVAVARLLLGQMGHQQPEETVVLALLLVFLEVQ
jgi:hypothetical protein